jgi:serralysin
MTYASYFGSPVPPPTDAVSGSSPQSLMMFDISALQALYGANYDKLGTAERYSWNTVTGQQLIDGQPAPHTGTTSTNKIFSTIWTQGAAATYDLSAFVQNQVDDIRPGHWLRFDNDKLADLNSDDPGSAIAQGNIYNALLYKGDLSSAIANLITGIGNDTLIGNGRDNMLSAGAGTDNIFTDGGNDIVRGGAGADTIHFGSGHSTLRDSLADLNGDVVREFGFGAVDVLGARLGWDSFSITADLTTVNAGGLTVALNGSFSGNGAFILSARGNGADAHTALGYVNYLPALAEGVSVNTSSITGIADQSFLTGDGAVRFTLEFKSAVSAFANSLGFYKVKADGSISDVHMIYDNTLNVSAGARSIDLGAPANGERIGFFLIQDGFHAYGHLGDDLSFSAPGASGRAATVDSGLAILQSASLGALTAATVFHSFAALNPNGANQVLSGVKPGGLELQIGFEDLPNATGDRDFQDVVIGIHVTGDGFLFT